MAKSVKWLSIAGGGQCLLKCWFHVKLEVEYSYRPLSPFKDICAKNTNFRFLRF